MKHSDIIKQLTLEEKASLCSGSDFWHTEAVERLGIPSVMMSDGPHGLRKQTFEKVANVHSSVPSTCFPTASALASSWDREIARNVGEAIAEEAASEEVSVVLGPGVNIKRNPLCGRNFEYYSEDPVLAGDMGAAFIEGLQKNGTVCSLKHFAANNQESARMTVSVEIDERTLNEIYLEPFKRAVKKAKPATLMCSYNKINGVYSSENPYILTEKLRKDWGFDGLVMTDWGAVNDRVKGVAAGLDLEMPSSGGVNGKKIVEAVKNGALEESALDCCVDNVLELVLNAKKNLAREHAEYDKSAHHALAAEIAAHCAVLLKNDGVLPLDKTEKVLLIGEMAKVMRYQGSGSSHINPTETTDFYDGFKAVGADFDYMRGYDGKNPQKSVKLTRLAVEAAASYDKIVVVAGLTDKYEAEGYDRESLDMPAEQNALISALAKTGKKIAVVLCLGAPVLMPWLDGAGAVMLSYLGGQAAGLAAARLLYGEVNPSGKLAETFPAKLSDVPSQRNFALNPQFCNYAESVYVGYRFNVTAGVEPLFPFGYGLSYTTFSYSDVEARTEGNTVAVSFDLTNTGGRDGAEVAQVYVSAQNPSVFRPKYELKGFEKVFLEKGEKRRVEIDIPVADLGFYDIKSGGFHTDDGAYKIYVGASCLNLPLETEIIIGEKRAAENAADCGWYSRPSVGEIPDADFQALIGCEPRKNYEITPRGEYSQNSTFYDMSQTSALARFIVKAAGFVIRRGMRCKKDDSAYKMILETFKFTPLINVTFTTQGAVSENRVKAILFILNGHKLRGFYRFVFNRPQK